MALRFRLSMRVPAPATAPARARGRGRVLSIVLAALTGCAATTTPATDTPPQSGVVRMRADRSLEIRLLAGEHGSRIDGVRIVAPEQRDYALILEGTGPMQPGDQRPYRAADARE